MSCLPPGLLVSDTWLSCLTAHNQGQPPRVAHPGSPTPGDPPRVTHPGSATPGRPPRVAHPGSPTPGRPPRVAHPGSPTPGHPPRVSSTAALLRTAHSCYQEVSTLGYFVQKPLVFLHLTKLNVPGYKEPMTYLQHRFIFRLESSLPCRGLRLKTTPSF